LALAFDLVPEQSRQEAARRLVEDVRRFKHLTTGFLGTPYLNPVLSASGHLDDAYALLLREQYPSWLYPIKQGATTIWQRWDGEWNTTRQSRRDPQRETGGGHGGCRNRVRTVPVRVRAAMRCSRGCEGGWTY